MAGSENSQEHKPYFEIFSKWDYGNKNVDYDDNDYLLMTITRIIMMNLNISHLSPQFFYPFMRTDQLKCM